MTACRAQRPSRDVVLVCDECGERLRTSIDTLARDLDRCDWSFGLRDGKPEHRCAACSLRA